jgi:CBS domain-containing protein
MVEEPLRPARPAGIGTQRRALGAGQQGDAPGRAHDARVAGGRRSFGLEGGRPVGIVTAAALATAVADQGPDTPIATVMDYVVVPVDP